ncbi:cysteine desulfurase [Tianweitania sp. BSSL-BM11]|uniref:Cysteine desulfurase n=2 Tax=Tianweitania aestuarii TaxID=2814886 RepID=A0ABS5RTD7_9HYPH|nr:cysteine desulfurase [Tianweitania aestuarii]
MMQSRAYLDHNASMPLRHSSRAAMIEALDVVGNPSSVHAEGRKVRQLVDGARRDVAALVGVDPARLVFTSGATEGAMTLLTPHWTMGRAPLLFSHLYVGATEHSCVSGGGRFAPEQMTVIPVGPNGVIDLAALPALLEAHDHAEGLPLVAVQAANNETGVVQPIEEITKIVRGAKGTLIVDAVQAAGRLPIALDAGFGDYLILSAHKIGGPKGVGAIASSSDVLMPAVLIRGGGQERGHRGGTENVSGIVGFGAAAREALGELGEMPQLAERRKELEAEMRQRVPDVVIHGAAAAQRLPNTIFFTIPGMKTETAQIAFDLAGIALSAGSACSSGKVGASKVLSAMHWDGDGALRVSFGLATSADDLARFTNALGTLAARRAGRQAA